MIISFDTPNLMPDGSILPYYNIYWKGIKSTGIEIGYKWGI